MSWNSNLEVRPKTGYDYEISEVGTQYMALSNRDDLADIGPLAGGALTNAVIDVLSPDGGEVLVKCLVAVDDEDVELLVLTSELTFRGLGARSGATKTQWLQSRSGFYFSNGYVITNNLSSTNQGKHVFRNLGLFWEGVTDKPLFLMDYVLPHLDTVYTGESGNTFTVVETYGIFTPDAGPTPNTESVIFDHVTMNLRSNNAVGYKVHFENASWIHPVIQFNKEYQTGFVFTDVSGNEIDVLDVWLGDPAQGCKVFSISNSEKRVNIGHIGMSTQAQAGATIPNILFGYRVNPFVGFTNNYINYRVGTTHGVPLTTTPTAPIYAFQDATVIPRVKIGLKPDDPEYGAKTWWYCSTCADTDIATDGTDEYLVFNGDDPPDTTEANQVQRLLHATRLSDMVVVLELKPDTGNSRTFTLRKNGINTALTVTISGEDRVGHDSTHTVDVGKNDELTWLSDGGVSIPQACKVNIRCKASVKHTVPRGAYTVIMYKDGTESVVEDSQGNEIERTTVGATALQAALDYIKDYGDGTLYGDGYHEITSEVKLSSRDEYIIQGSGRPSNEWYPDTSGGFVLEFSGASGRFADYGEKQAKITFRDMGLMFTGVQTDAKLDLAYSIVVMERVLWDISCNGNTAVISIGTSGPSGCTFRLTDIILVDNRNGGAYQNILGIHVESGVIDGLMWIANIGGSITAARGIYFYNVSWITVKNLVIFTTGGQAEPYIPGFDIDNRQYDYQFICASGGTFRIICENVQFFEDADIITGAIVAPDTSTFIIEGKNPTEFEGSAVIVKPSTGGLGTVKLQFKGRGYENLIASTGTGSEQTIPHGLVDTPTHVILSPSGANISESSTRDNTNLYITADTGEVYTIQCFYWEE